MILYEGVVMNESELGFYEALSYTWDEPSFTKPLVCDGLVFPISENLFSALQYLRLPHIVTILWVDAVLHQSTRPTLAREVARPVRCVTSIAK
jgi:hypothetical protein